MMLGVANCKMEVYRVILRAVKGTFEMDADVTKMEKPQLMTLENPRYKKASGQAPTSKGSGHGRRR